MSEVAAAEAQAESRVLLLGLSHVLLSNGDAKGVTVEDVASVVRTSR